MKVWIVVGAPSGDPRDLRMWPCSTEVAARRHIEGRWLLRRDELTYTIVEADVDEPAAPPAPRTVKASRAGG